MVLRHDYARWRAYVRDSILDPAVGRDLLALELVRKPALLRQVFAVCAAHPAEILSLQKIAGVLDERGAVTTIAHYLQLLEEAYLVAGVQKYAVTEMRRRASPPKVVSLSNAFLTPPGGEAPRPGTDIWGRWVENACLASLLNRGHKVWYWRDEPSEVDAVVDDGAVRWAIEVKTTPFTPRDLAALLEFSHRCRCRSLVLCEEEQLRAARHAGVEAMTWQAFLWYGLGGLAP
ncbi:MAG: ATP-binding protein [Candidatus Xenobia bacterium]